VYNFKDGFLNSEQTTCATGERSVKGASFCSDLILRIDPQLNRNFVALYGTPSF